MENCIISKFLTLFQDFRRKIYQCQLPPLSAACPVILYTLTLLNFLIRIIINLTFSELFITFF